MLFPPLIFLDAFLFVRYGTFERLVLYFYVPLLMAAGSYGVDGFLFLGHVPRTGLFFPQRSFLISLPLLSLRQLFALSFETVPFCSSPPFPVS